LAAPVFGLISGAGSSNNEFVFVCDPLRVDAEAVASDIGSVKVAAENDLWGIRRAGRRLSHDDLCVGG